MHNLDYIEQISFHGQIFISCTIIVSIGIFVTLNHPQLIFFITYGRCGKKLLSKIYWQFKKKYYCNKLSRLYYVLSIIKKKVFHVMVIWISRKRIKPQMFKKIKLNKLYVFQNCMLFWSFFIHGPHNMSTYTHNNYKNIYKKKKNDKC